MFGTLQVNENSLVTTVINNININHLDNININDMNNVGGNHINSINIGNPKASNGANGETIIQNELGKATDGMMKSIQFPCCSKNR